MEAEAAFTVQQVVATAFLLYLCTFTYDTKTPIAITETNKDNVSQLPSPLT